jgi:hypothetical protein
MSRGVGLIDGSLMVEPYELRRVAPDVPDEEALSGITAAAPMVLRARRRSGVGSGPCGAGVVGRSCCSVLPGVGSGQRGDRFFECVAHGLVGGHLAALVVRLCDGLGG